LASVEIAPPRPGAGAGPEHSHRFRHDIQALRGLAIVLVLLHHARFPYLPGGFLGVDIFFVISGFLMARWIDEGLDNRDFTLREFYVRRIRRLLPAAYATLIVTALLAPWLLAGSEYRAFVAQLAGSFAFAANIVLWKQADYFGTAATLKPLLHMWSLAVEEQFYLILPVAMMLLRSRWRLPAIAAASAASFALCLYLVPRNPDVAFYLLPSRAWELGLGAIVALLVRRGLVPIALPAAVRLACAVVLVGLPLFVDEAGHPGWAALGVCLATAGLLVPPVRSSASAGLLKPATMIGDRSYSLYLVHWPVFAFANNISLMPLGAISAVLVLVCLVWAEAQYRLVETPLRRFAVTWRSLGILVLLPVIVVGVSLAWTRIGHLTPDDAAGGQGLAKGCDYGARFDDRAGCRSGKSAATMVWGDSFSMSLAPGLAAVTPGGIVQASRSVCGPFVGLAPTKSGKYSRGWSQSCLAFNDSVLAYLGQHPEIRTVVLTSALAQYVPGAEPNWRLLRRTADGSVEEPQSTAALDQALAATVAALHAQGKRVVLFAPPPSDGTDIGRCLARTGEGKLTIPVSDCSISLESYHAVRASLLAYVAGVARAGIVPVVSLDPGLCDERACATRSDGTALYRDTDHLSAAGSILVARRMAWDRLIAERAR
jgi:peptidoglycan/LPS O-acetylase OafA/YrhL